MKQRKSITFGQFNKANNKDQQMVINLGKNKIDDNNLDKHSEESIETDSSVEDSQDEVDSSASEDENKVMENTGRKLKASVTLIMNK